MKVTVDVFNPSVSFAVIEEYIFLIIFKVKNKLDDREYAVKKVPLKETHPDLCLKVKRKDRLSQPLLNPLLLYLPQAGKELERAFRKTKKR